MYNVISLLVGKFNNSHENKVKEMFIYLITKKLKKVKTA